MFQSDECSTCMARLEIIFWLKTGRQEFLPQPEVWEGHGRLLQALMSPGSRPPDSAGALGSLWRSSPGWPAAWECSSWGHWPDSLRPSQSSSQGSAACNLQRCRGSSLGGMKGRGCIYLLNWITWIWLTLIKIPFFALLNQRHIKSKYCLLKHETWSALRLNSRRPNDGNSGNS